MSKLVIKDTFGNEVIKHNLDKVVEVHCTRFFGANDVHYPEIYNFIGYDKPLVKKDGCIEVILKKTKGKAFIEVYPASNYYMYYELDLISK